MVGHLELTRGSIRLGQWMDWGNDYFTFSDTNIEYIWRFLRHMHDNGLALPGPPLDRVVPALRHVHLAARADRALLGQDRPVPLRPLPAARPRRRVARRLDDDALDAPANVAAAVNPDAEYGRRENGEWVAVARAPDDAFVSASGARRSSASPTRARSTTSGGPRGRAPRHPVGGRLARGGHGIVHIAPGCGSEDFELSRVHELAVLTPVDEAGRFNADYGWLHGQGTAEAAEQIVADLAERGRLIAADEIVHRFPFCWRCHTPLIFRLSDDWFLAVEELRRSCWRRTRRSRGRPPTWASAWTTGCATWATGTSHGAATTACRSRSTRARAAT